MSPRVEVQFSSGCPHARPAIALVREVAATLAPQVQVDTREVRTASEARSEGFAGSPTILVNGRDIEPGGGAPGVLACRVYAGSGGVPPRWKVESALLRALAPRHILFLCVANSARSQMAEGIARALAPAGVTVSSAGSEPTQVRPQAIRALAELGIDISAHRAKPILDVDASSVQAVITLCADEVCPVFLGNARRLHWGLPDPASVQGPPEVMLQAFRVVRDELQERLAHLFDGWPA